MIFTDSDLQQIMPKLPQAKRQLYLPFLNRLMEIYEIDTPLRASAFLAQIAHESGELRFMEEIWGPTPQQKRYEPPSDLARRLGNTQPGDGFRYRGRGPIQITGRANYRKYGNLLGVDLERNPDLAATPQYAFSTAALYWKTNGLNELADVRDFITITRRINGGLNGLQDRQKYYAVARNVLGADEPADFAFAAVAAPTTTRGAAATAGSTAPPTLPPPALPRGQEAIEEEIGPTANDAASPDGERAAKKKSGRANQKPAQTLVPNQPVAKAARKSAKVAVKVTTRKSVKKVVVKKTVVAKKKAPAKKSR